MNSVSKIATRWLRRADAKDGKKTGTGEGVGLFLPLPKPLADQFPSLGGEDKSPPHVTFLYVGEVPREEEQLFLDALREVLRDQSWPKVIGRLSHVDIFQHPDKERNVAHMAVQFSHPMAELRDRVRSHLENKGIAVNDSFPVYRPHATLQYMPGLASSYRGDPVQGEWEFDSVEVWGLPKVYKINFSRGKRASEHIPGGLAKGKKPGDFDPEQLAKGTKVELEHTPDRDVAREIAMDHLTEDPKYYDKLESIEKHAKGKYDHINFKPPESVANAAKKGLEYRRKQKGDKAGLTPEEASKEGIGSGVQRAVNLKNRDELSPETIRQMSGFFSRHEKNKAIDAEHKGEPWKDNGYVSWLLWGGDPGKAWAEKILEQMERADKPSKKAFVAEDGWDEAGHHRFILWPDDEQEEEFLNGPVRSLFESQGYFTGRVGRGGRLGIEFHAEPDGRVAQIERVAGMYLARKELLDLGRIEKFRKDFLTLMKNAKIVKDYDQAWQWREAVRRWQDGFEQFVDRARKAIKDLRFQKRITKDDADYWVKKLGSDVWSLHIEFRVPLESLKAMRQTWGPKSDEDLKSMAFARMKEELPRWEGRVRRAARKAWKALKSFEKWYAHRAEAPLEVDIPTDERLNIEGFTVVVRGFDKGSPIAHLYAEGMEQFKAGLKRYKQRAQRVLPLLLRAQLPLVVDFTMGLDEGGLYERTHIAINPMAAHDNPGRMAQILAHEMGHHIYKNYLSKRDREFWSRVLTGNYGTLNLKEVLRKYGNESSLFDNKRIKREDPLLYLQIMGLYDMPGAERIQDILSMDALREYLASGGQEKWRVHGKPITGYAHKNNEEAFCEALGMLVGYGPRTVLPEVRQWLKTILPQIKTATQSRKQCMEKGCRKAPEVECVWAEGRARAWFCQKHFDAWSKEDTGEGLSKAIVKQRKVPDGRVGEKYGEKSAKLNDSWLELTPDVLYRAEAEDEDDEDEDIDDVFAAKVAAQWLKKRAGWWAIKPGNPGINPPPVDKGGLVNAIPGEDPSTGAMYNGDGPADTLTDALRDVDLQYLQAWGRPATRAELEAAWSFVTGPVLPDGRFDYRDGPEPLNQWFIEFCEWLGKKPTEVCFYSENDLMDALRRLWDEGDGPAHLEAYRKELLEAIDKAKTFGDDATLVGNDLADRLWSRISVIRDEMFRGEDGLSGEDMEPEIFIGRVASLYLEASAHRRSIALMKFLSEAAQRLGVARHVYVVGGAVRNFVIDKPIKDIDVVIDSVAAGRDSDWFAKELARRIPAPTNITTNQYGVAILTVKGDWVLDGENMNGEVIEIANARSESYTKGQGYKPTEVQPATIEQDVYRREFTFNALMWRLLDLAKGPEKAEIIDLTGCGLRDLQEGKLKCPSDPDKTFSDDPSRMLRAIKFTGKYGFKVPPDVARSIKKNAPKMKRMPWEAIGKILVENVLNEPSARKSLKQMEKLGLLDVVSEMIQEQKPFAKYMANQLRRNRKVQLLLDLMDLGVPASTPLHFLNPKQRKRVREITVAMPEDEAAKFADKLIKPPVNNKEVIDKLMLPASQRRNIQPLARQLLLENPELAENPHKLTDAVIKRWR